MHSRKFWEEIKRSQAVARKGHLENSNTSRWALGVLAHWAENETPCGPCALARRFGAMVPILDEPCGWRP